MGIRTAVNAAVLATAAVLGGAGVAAAEPDPVLVPVNPTGSIGGAGAGSGWVVSLGDSYISGEAGRWAGNAAGGVIEGSPVRLLNPTVSQPAPSDVDSALSVDLREILQQLGT